MIKDILIEISWLGYAIKMQYCQEKTTDGFQD